MQNLSLIELIEHIDEPNKARCKELLSDHKERFEKSPGSKTKHQAWPGGYIDHLQEIMNLAVGLYAFMSAERQLPFSLSDALLVLFLHDLEKPFKYVDEKQITNKKEERLFIGEVIGHYNIELAPMHRNALEYVHGEGDDYHPTERVQSPLAAFAHVCDTISARIWFDYPRRS